MYKCKRCNKQSMPGEKEFKIVLSSRQKEYAADIETNDPGGYGWEIVKEITVCKECNDIHLAEEAKKANV